MPLTQRRAPTIDMNLSDLFFNRDFSGVKQYDSKHQFTGFDEDGLRQEAKDFLSSLEGLGVADLPDPDALIIDFYDRL